MSIYSDSEMFSSPPQTVNIQSETTRSKPRVKKNKKEKATAANIFNIQIKKATHKPIKQVYEITTLIEKECKELRVVNQREVK